MTVTGHIGPTALQFTVSIVFLMMIHNSISSTFCACVYVYLCVCGYVHVFIGMQNTYKHVFIGVHICVCTCAHMSFIVKAEGQLGYCSSGATHLVC